MIHAYLICEPPTAASLPSRRGLGGARLRVALADGLAAIYSQHRSLRASPERVLAHERVIEAAMANGTVLPLRFGTRLGGEEELRAAISARRDDLVAALERVRGQVEMGLRVIPRGPRGPERGGDLPERASGGQDGEKGSGRAYLLKRVAEHRVAEQAREDLHLPLATLARDSSLATRLTPPAILVASYLVPADEAGDFRARAEELAAGLKDVQSFVTGPWPPYNFAQLPDRRSGPQEES